MSHACGISFPDQGSNPGPLHWELRVLPTGPPGKFPCGSFLNNKCNFFNRDRVIQLTLLEWTLIIGIFQRICQFHLSCQIYWHKVAHNIFYYSLIVWRICSDITSPIPDIVYLCLLFFFPDHPTRGLSIWYIFTKKKQLLTSLTFLPVVFLFLILLISALVFIISFLLINLDLICSFLIF